MSVLWRVCLIRLLTRTLPFYYTNVSLNVYKRIKLIRDQEKKHVHGFTRLVYWNHVTGSLNHAPIHKWFAKDSDLHEAPSLTPPYFINHVNVLVLLWSWFVLIKVCRFLRKNKKQTILKLTDLLVRATIIHKINYFHYTIIQSLSQSLKT